MNHDHLSAYVQLLATMRGGQPPAQEALIGLTAQEQNAGDHLYAAGIEATHPVDDRRVQALAYLIEHAPGLTIDKAIQSLTQAQLDEFLALMRSDDDAL